MSGALYVKTSKQVVRKEIEDESANPTNMGNVRVAIPGEVPGAVAPNHGSARMNM